MIHTRSIWVEATADNPLKMVLVADRCIIIIIIEHLTGSREMRLQQQPLGLLRKQLLLPHQQLLTQTWEDVVVGSSNNRLLKSCGKTHLPIAQKSKRIIQTNSLNQIYRKSKQLNSSRRSLRTLRSVRILTPIVDSLQALLNASPQLTFVSRSKALPHLNTSKPLPNKTRQILRRRVDQVVFLGQIDLERQVELHQVVTYKTKAKISIKRTTSTT